MIADYNQPTTHNVYINVHKIFVDDTATGNICTNSPTPYWRPDQSEETQKKEKIAKNEEYNRRLQKARLLGKKLKY